MAKCFNNPLTKKFQPQNRWGAAAVKQVLQWRTPFHFHLRHATPSMSGDEDDAQEDRRKISSTMEKLFFGQDAVG